MSNDGVSVKYILFLMTFLLSTPLCPARQIGDDNGQQQQQPGEEVGFACTGASEPEPLPPWKMVKLGDVTRKALAMPYPKMANASSLTGQVKAEVVIDLMNGKVVWARVVSVAPSMGEAVKKVVCKATFLPVNDIPPIKGRGFITYTFKARGGVRPNKVMSRTRNKRVS